MHKDEPLMSYATGARVHCVRDNRIGTINAVATNGDLTIMLEDGKVRVVERSQLSGVTVLTVGWNGDFVDPKLHDAWNSYEEELRINKGVPLTRIIAYLVMLVCALTAMTAIYGEMNLTGPTATLVEHRTYINGTATRSRANYGVVHSTAGLTFKHGVYSRVVGFVTGLAILASTYAPEVKACKVSIVLWSFAPLILSTMHLVLVDVVNFVHKPEDALPWERDPDSLWIFLGAMCISPLGLQIGVPVKLLNTILVAIVIVELVFVSVCTPEYFQDYLDHAQPVWTPLHWPVFALIGQALLLQLNLQHQRIFIMLHFDNTKASPDTANWYSSWQKLQHMIGVQTTNQSALGGGIGAGGGSVVQMDSVVTHGNSPHASPTQFQTDDVEFDFLSMFGEGFALPADDEGYSSHESVNKSSSRSAQQLSDSENSSQNSGADCSAIIKRRKQEPSAECSGIVYVGSASCPGDPNLYHAKREMGAKATVYPPVQVYNQSSPPTYVHIEPKTESMSPVFVSQLHHTQSSSAHDNSLQYAQDLDQSMYMTSVPSRSNSTVRYSPTSSYNGSDQGSQGSQGSEGSLQACSATIKQETTAPPPPPPKAKEVQPTAPKPATKQSKPRKPRSGNAKTTKARFSPPVSAQGLQQNQFAGLDPYTGLPVQPVQKPLDQSGLAAAMLKSATATASQAPGLSLAPSSLAAAMSPSADSINSCMASSAAMTAAMSPAALVSTMANINGDTAMALLTGDGHMALHNQVFTVLASHIGNGNVLQGMKALQDVGNWFSRKMTESGQQQWFAWSEEFMTAHGVKIVVLGTILKCQDPGMEGGSVWFIHNHSQLLSYVNAAVTATALASHSGTVDLRAKWASLS